MITGFQAGVMGAYGGLWTPANITTALWLDAADSSTIAIDTGVSQWSDKSGNSRNFGQSTAANQPVISTTLNLKNVITFDGVDDYLGAESAVLTTTHSLFLVFVPKIEAAIGSLFGQWVASQVGRTQFVCNQNSGGAVAAGAFNPFNSTATNGAGAAAFTNHVSITNVGTLIESLCTTGSESCKLLKNGTEWDSATITAVYSGTNTAIGSANATVSLNPYDGSVAEIVMVSSVVSVSDRQKIEGYLAHKLGPNRQPAIRSPL